MQKSITRERLRSGGVSQCWCENHAEMTDANNNKPPTVSAPPTEFLNARLPPNIKHFLALFRNKKYNPVYPIWRRQVFAAYVNKVIWQVVVNRRPKRLTSHYSAFQSKLQGGCCSRRPLVDRMRTTRLRVRIVDHHSRGLKQTASW